jgi:hypothetical protein
MSLKLSQMFSKSLRKKSLKLTLSRKSNEPENQLLKREKQLERRLDIHEAIMLATMQEIERVLKREGVRKKKRQRRRRLINSIKRLI